MSRPGILLVILLLLATAAGYSLHQVKLSQTRPKPVQPVEFEPATPSNAEDPAPPEVSQTPTPADDSGNTALLLNEAFRLSRLRELPYQEALSFKKQSPADLQSIWKRDLDATFPSDSLSRFGLVLQLLGFLDPSEDLDARFRAAPTLFTDAYYDAQNNELLYTETNDPSQAESRATLSQQLLLMLLEQQFQWREQQIPIEVNMDQALAQRAFVGGDAFWHMLRYNEMDAAKSPVWQLADARAQALPPILRDAVMLPFREGVHFCQAIVEAGVALDSIYQQRPATTAHLLHPDRYLRTPRYEPRQVRWAQLDIKRHEPTWDNVLGEVLIRSALRMHVSHAMADVLAAGWDGDGVLLYQTDTQGPQLLWKTAWRDAAAAKQFFNWLDTQGPTLFEVAREERQVFDDERRVVYPSVLEVDLTLKDDTVTLLRTTEPEWAAALKELSARSPFEKRG